MSHIVKSEDTYYMLNDVIYDVEKYGISASLLMYLMNELMPKQDVVGYAVVAGKLGEGKTTFALNKKTIEIYSGKVRELVYCCVKNMMEKYEIKDKKVLNGYQLIHILTHEIEHAYQYLFSNGTYRVPYEAINVAYKDIFEMLENGKNIDKYNERRSYLLLERNAQIESTDLVLRLAYFNNRQDIYDAYNSLMTECNLLGYKENPEGNILETYKEFKLDTTRLNLDEEINEDERIRYGFPISEESRELLLKRSKAGIK